MNSEQALQVDRPAIGVHGRKRSHRLSQQGQKLLDSLLPILSAPLDVAAQDPKSLFTGACQEIWLEVGFGDGRHLAWRAGENPHIGFIGCEPYVNGVAHLLTHIAETGLGNIRIHPGDARDLLAALPGGSIGRIYLLFPDPWPRVRHHKRRFISPQNLTAMARALRPGGQLIFASDSMDYCRWTQALMENHSGFTQVTQQPGDAPITRYEAKARAAGRPARYLCFARTSIAI